MGTLATVVGNQAALRERLRILCGLPGDTQTLPDASCDAYLDMALSRINDMAPVVGIGSFNTVSGTQVYQPLPANARSVRQSWYCDDSVALAGESYLGLRTWLAELDAMLGQPIDDIGTRVAYDPATVALVLRKAQQVQRWIGTGFAVVNGGADVYLSPVPSSVRAVYFSFLANRFATVGAVTDAYFDAFWAAACAAALGAVAIGAGSVTNVQDSQEGTSITLKLGDNAAKAAAAHELRFLRMMSLPPVPDWLFG